MLGYYIYTTYTIYKQNMEFKLIIYIFCRIYV